MFVLGRGVGRLGRVGSPVFNVVALVGAESSHFQGVTRCSSWLENRFLRVLCGWVSG